MQTNKIKQIMRLLKDKSNKTILISSHQNMEGDAIGSQLALANLVRRLGKKPLLFSPDTVPAIYRFMQGAKDINKSQKGKKIQYDLACFVDCTGFDRIGPLKESLDFSKPIINIDHHVSNTRFGTIDWISTDISCSGVQVYYLFKESGIPIDKNAALCIYVAMVTDTGSFRYSNTTAQTHRIAAEMLDKGVDPTQTYRLVYEQAHRTRLTMLTAVLSTLNTTKDEKIAWVRITKAALKKHKRGEEGTDDCINFPRSIKGVKIAMAFREIGKNTTKVSFRSNEGVDVCKLAKVFDGGGHPSASGCTIKKNISEAEKAVVSTAKKFVREG